MTTATPPNLPDNPEPMGGSLAPSQVFVLRLWHNGPAGWRGQVHHVTSGETRYFRAWLGLVAHLEALLVDRPASDQPETSGNEEVAP